MVLADGLDVDVVGGKWTWELAAGGYLDERDAAALLAVGDRDALVREVEARIEDLRPDIRAAWLERLRRTGE
jgi:hypothetical protein